MAAMASIHHNSPLTERTNATSSHDDSDPQRLRRSKSSQSLAYDFGSSECLFVDYESIYNAEIVSPIEKLTLSQTPPLTTTKHLSKTITEDVIPLSLSQFGTSTPYSGWPPTRLDPVQERRNRSTLRNTSSFPRLRQSPERSLKFTRPEVSIRSIRPRHPSSPSGSLQSTVPACHVRSFSLNDLGCLPKSDTNQAFQNAHDRSSSSSAEILKAIGRCPNFPRRPVAPVPYRAPTPPGLPSFRTREAQEYRLTSSAPPSRTMTFLSRWLRQHDTEREEHMSITSSLSGSALSPLSSSTPQENLPMDMLKRMLGVSRVVTSPPQSDLPSRVSLPPGVRIESSPGILIQADDGTAVRGRWANRTSAHGVGSRPLDAHPLSRAAGPVSVDEIVREIDKACEAVALSIQQVSSEQEVRPMNEQLQPGSPHAAGLNRQNQADVQRVRDYHAHMRASLARAQSQLRTHRDKITISTRDSIPSNVRSRPTSNVMQEPGSYSRISRPRGHDRDSLRAFQEYVRQGEEEHVRQQAETIRERKEEDRLKRCWEMFWLACCGIKHSTY